MTDRPPQRMRTRDEIQRAHDIFHPLATGEVPPIHDEQGAAFLRVALDTLCWVLHHDHCDGFARNLAEIERALANKGYRIGPIDPADPIGAELLTGGTE